jgi:hypothetical protein
MPPGADVGTSDKEPNMRRILSLLLVTAVLVVAAGVGRPVTTHIICSRRIRSCSAGG